MTLVDVKTNKMNKLVYIGFAFPHHKGTHAGYHHIKDYLGYDYIIDIQPVIDECNRNPKNILLRLKRKIFRKLFCGYAVFPRYILKCLWLAISKGHMTFHFIYGENSYLRFPLNHIRGCRVVTTLHQPLEWFQDNPPYKRILRKMDEVILVGKSEVEEFKKLTRKDNVHFFPHGICADFYCPDSNEQKENMVLMVGNWLRDFEFASALFSMLQNAMPSVRVVVVTNRNNAHFFKNNENVEVLSGISDDELLSLYRRTACLFLPLKRYTANNALLEAGAVGCNILIASNHADNSYIPERLINICPLDKNEAFTELLKLMKQDANKKLAEFVRQNYSWEIVGKEVKSFFDNMKN